MTDISPMQRQTCGLPQYDHRHDQHIGAELIKKDSLLGFSTKSDEAKTQQQVYSRMKDKVMGE